MSHPTISATIHLVIADAGPLIALAKLDRLALLHALYGGAVVTQTVWMEATGGAAGGVAFADAPRIEAARAATWLQVVPDPVQAQALPELAAIDPGERSALHLGLQTVQAGASALLVLDDANARMAARALALPVVGTLGVLLRAKQRRLLSRLQPEIDALQGSGYYLSGALVAEVMRLAGEARA